MAALGDIDQNPIRANTQHTKKWCVVVPIGASGATGTLLQSPEPALTVTKNGTGVYDVAGMPVCLAITSGKSRVILSLYSPALTVGCAVVTATSFTAGTMTIKTLVGVTATEPASGDYIIIHFEGESE